MAQRAHSQSWARGNGTFVGFGFGPIQAGLFCYEAVRSGAFRHIVVAEIGAQKVAEIRNAGGFYNLNIAHPDHVEMVKVGPVRLENPALYADRARLVEAIAIAQEIATAVPSVRAYGHGGAESLHLVLAQGLQRKAAISGPPATIYAAENHPRAAELLREAVMEEVPEAERAVVGCMVSFVNTVIPKMSVVLPPAEGLAPLTANSERAYLVDPFNKIMTGRPRFDQDGAIFTSGFPTFVSKENLTPFGDAKFLGHNGIHALGAYLGMAAGMTFVCEWAETPGMIEFIRAAFVDEVGAGLVHRYTGMDTLFTPAGFAAFADDLLARTVNPFLRDTIARLGRDPQRKLGWDDRLIGAMRITHAAGITPWRFAMGAAAALAVLEPGAEPQRLLPALWQSAAPPKEEAAAMLALVQEGKMRFERWRQAGFPDLAHQI